MPKRAERRNPDGWRPRSATERSDRALAERSRGQHHVLTLAQLEAAGLSPRGVRHRAASGRLVRIHGGVYAVGPPTREGRWTAAVLACGEGALLSHRSAAELWDLVPYGSGPIHITSADRTGRDRPDLAVHAGRVPRAETAERDGIPCTSVARTLLDLAASADARALERALDRAETLRHFDLHALRASIARHRGRRGVARLREALASYDGPVLTASEAEERLLALVRAAALPAPRVNAPLAVAGTVYRADFLWSDRRLIVEVDGRDYHSRRRAFEHDRVRDRRLALAGYETRRFAAGELHRDPGGVVAEIAAFLHLTPSTGG